MAANNGSAPVQDMESILAALAAVTKQEQERQRIQREQPPKSQEDDEEDEYDPSKAYDPSHIGGAEFPNEGPYGPSSSSDPLLLSLGGKGGLPSAEIYDSRNNPSLIDPAMITEWPMALRCVSKMAAQNPNFKLIIRKMMADQEKHERMWWEGRQEIFKRAGVSLVQNLPPPLKAELQAYESKVLKATQGMVRGMSTELKMLGVPFFGVNPDLVLPDNIKSAPSPQSGVQKVSNEKLLTLQRRMIQYLEDMYRV